MTAKEIRLLTADELKALLDAQWVRLKTLPSTNATIATGLTMAVVYILTCLAGDMAKRPVSEVTQNTIGMFIMGMIVGGVAQFGLKRSTDEKAYAGKAAVAAAKSSGATPTTTTTETAGPSTTTTAPAPDKGPE